MLLSQELLSPSGAGTQRICILCNLRVKLVVSWYKLKVAKQRTSVGCASRQLLANNFLKL